MSPPAAVLIAIAVGGAAGALIRAGLDAVSIAGGWPVTTLAVNLVGTVMLTALAAVLAWRPRLPHWLHPLVGVGLCGSLTTFAGIQMEALLLMRDGASATAVLYVLVSVALGLTAVVATRRVMRLAVR